MAERYEPILVFCIWVVVSDFGLGQIDCNKDSSFARYDISDSNETVKIIILPGELHLHDTWLVVVDTSVKNIPM